MEDDWENELDQITSAYDNIFAKESSTNGSVVKPRQSFVRADSPVPTTVHHSVPSIVREHYAPPVRTTTLEAMRAHPTLSKVVDYVSDVENAFQSFVSQAVTLREHLQELVRKANDTPKAVVEATAGELKVFISCVRLLIQIIFLLPST
jgi:hypothetical protein